MYTNNKKSPYDVYKSNSINLASKEQLLLMILDGSVKYARMARQAIVENDVQAAHNNLVKVQNIYAELMATLDTNAGKWAKDIFTIYTYIHKELREINMKKDLERMDAIMPLIEQVREIWHEAYKETLKTKPTNK